MSDLIKRSDAIDVINEAFDIGDCCCDRYGIIGAIQSISSADRPRGEWIDTGKVYFGAKVYACSVCGEECDEMPTCMGKPMWKYCPYCGAKMKGADDEMR